MRSRSAPPCTTAQTTRPAVDPVHPQHDPPVVEADDVAGVQIGGEARVFDRERIVGMPAPPSTSRIVAPSRISAGPPWPVRIFGPCRSCTTAIDFPRARAASRTMVRRRAWSSCVPCEKLSRATSIPASIRSPIALTSSVAGPNVQTILAWRRLMSGGILGTELGVSK